MTASDKEADRLMRVLVLAPRGRDAALIGEALEAAGFTLEACANVSQLAAHMRDGAGAAVITEEALAEGVAELVTVMEGEPSWSDFPVILLAEREHLARDGTWPADALRDAVILPRPLTPETLVSVIRVPSVPTCLRHNDVCRLVSVAQGAVSNDGSKNGVCS